jgi:hypothetical protein
LSLPFANLKDGKSLGKLVGEQLKSLVGGFKDVELLRRCMEVRDLEFDDNGCRGRMFVGEYGFSADIVNSKAKKVSYQKQKTDAELLPFFFDLSAPKNDGHGLLVLQRLGRGGIKGYFETYVLEPVGELSKKRVSLNAVMPKALLQKLMTGGRITEVRIIKHEIPNDIADIFNGKNKAIEGDFEWVLRPKGNGEIKQKIFNAFLAKPSGTIADHVVIPDFDYQTVKVEIDVGGGRKRLVDFGSLKSAKATFDVGDDIELGLDGYPTFKSLKKASAGVVKEIAIGVGVKI